MLHTSLRSYCVSSAALGGGAQHSAAVRRTWRRGMALPHHDESLGSVHNSKASTIRSSSGKSGHGFGWWQ